MALLKKIFDVFDFSYTIFERIVEISCFCLTTYKMPCIILLDTKEINRGTFYVGTKLILW